jgi:hypothetical protein
MSSQAVWHGTSEEASVLAGVIARNCTCEFGLMGVRITTCGPRRSPKEAQRALDGLLFARVWRTACGARNSRRSPHASEVRTSAASDRIGWDRSGTRWSAAAAPRRWFVVEGAIRLVIGGEETERLRASRAHHT